MKLLHKLALPLVALAGMMLATPAQAYWHHHRYYRTHVVVVGSPYYYGPGYYSGYYGPYYRPYYGGGVTFAFGGHHSSRRRHWR